MSIFARQHYQAIAEVFATKTADVYSTHSEYIAACNLAEDFCDMFLLDNPNFNRERFLKACGMEGEAS